MEESEALTVAYDLAAADGHTLQSAAATEDGMAYVQAAELTYTKVRALNMSQTICFQPVSALFGRNVGLAAAGPGAVSRS